MLEKLMDDDSDMHAMHLTARAYDQLERQAGLRLNEGSSVQLLGFVFALLPYSVYALQSLLDSLQCLYGIAAVSETYGGQRLIQAFSHAEDAADRIRQRAGAGADDGRGCTLVPQEPR